MSSTCCARWRSCYTCPTATTSPPRSARATRRLDRASRRSAADQREKLVTVIGELTLAEPRDAAQRVDRRRPRLRDGLQRAVVENDIRRHAVLARDLRPPGPQPLE